MQLFLVDWPGSRHQEARQLMSVFSSDEVVPGISPTAPVGLAIGRIKMSQCAFLGKMFLIDQSVNAQSEEVITMSSTT